MEKVTHDAIPRRPVVTVAGEVVGAEATALEHGLATVDTQTHGWTPRGPICTFIAASSTATRFTLGRTVVGRRLHRCGVRRGRGPPAILAENPNARPAARGRAIQESRNGETQMTNNTKFARFGALLAASLFAAALPALYDCDALRAESAASTEELVGTRLAVS